MTPDEHLRTAVDLVRTMMASASSEQIRRVEWWSRARSALETAAQSADSFGSLVSVMGRKLQIDATTIATGRDVAALALVAGSDFEAFRRFCDREALYVVARAQAESNDRREKREAEQKARGIDDPFINHIA